MKRLKSLLTKKGRRSNRQFLAEGIRLLEESLRHNFMPHQIFYSPSDLPERGSSLLGRFRKAGIAVESISRKELAQLADTETPQGLIALFNEPSYAIERVFSRKIIRAVLLDNIADPGNAGTLIRSALAFGFDTALAGPGTVEEFSPKIIRASSGAVFGLPIIRIEPDDIGTIKKKEHIMIIAADLKGKDLDKIEPERLRQERMMLAIGAEAAGLSEYVRQYADELVRIPHSDAVESLNAAVAGSIIMKTLYDSRL